MSNCFPALMLLKGHSVPAEVLCFHDYGQELALSLYCYLEFEETIAESDRSKEM